MSVSPQVIEYLRKMADETYFTAEEVAQHNKPGDLWVIIRGFVFDITNFDDHPGGPDVLKQHAGGDATEAYDAAGHDETLWLELNSKFKKGKIGLGQREAAERMISMEELQRHDKKDDLWLLIHDEVYDVSKFRHPGGKDILLDHTRREVGDEFDNIQHKNAHLHMPKYRIGKII